MDYLAVKHSHMAIAMLSVILFYVRSFSRMGSGKLAKNKLVFIGSHGIDTLLLVSALMLMGIAKINPFELCIIVYKAQLFLNISSHSSPSTLVSSLKSSKLRLRFLKCCSMNDHPRV